MNLAEYLTGYRPDGESNFDFYDATMPNGGKITAHHGRDKSTEKYYAERPKGHFIVSYVMPDGAYHRCQAVPGETQVSVAVTKQEAEG